MLSLFPRDVLDEIWDLIESVSEVFLATLSCNRIKLLQIKLLFKNEIYNRYVYVRFLHPMTHYVDYLYMSGYLKVFFLFSVCCCFDKIEKIPIMFPGFMFCRAFDVFYRNLNLSLLFLL